MVDPHKICFISYVNDENLYEECLLYLKQLQLLQISGGVFGGQRGCFSNQWI